MRAPLARLMGTPPPATDSDVCAPHHGGTAMRLRLIGMAVLILAALLGAVPAVAAQDDPATVVQRFFDARNRYDVAGTLALVTDDFRLIGGPQCTPASPCVGREALRAEMQNYIAGRAQVTIVGTPQVSGTTVRARVEGRADVFRAAGAERIINDVTMEVRDGKLASLVGVPDASDPQTARYLAFLRNQQGAGAPPPGMPNTGGGGRHQVTDSRRAALGTLLGLGLAGSLGWAGRAARRRGPLRTTPPAREAR